MNIIIILAVIALCIVTVIKSYFQQKKEHDELIKANRDIGALDDRVVEYVKKIHSLEMELYTLRQNYQKLQHQKISADVKLGDKAQNLLPFLSTFPYQEETDEIRGLFNPIDLIVFREEEVIFVEIKSGQSQLSEKQRRIRDNIKAGRVKFEVHRMDENGVKVK